ncbi:MAG: hypothetical protein GX927_05640 [Lentisphaerae bacterium]|jgi:hypothetical protein|nr:hypothetical protein [Lentisphaerota bacterium]
MKIQLVTFLLAVSLQFFLPGLLLAQEGLHAEIKTAATPQSQVLEFPAVRKTPGEKVCLAFRGYLKTTEPGGWNNFLELNLNGKNLEKYTQNGEYRLLRRGKCLKTSLSGAEERDWWRNHLLMIYFGPGDKRLDERILFPREAGYDYLLDVSDLVNYVEIGADNRIEAAHHNRLKITNNLLSRMVANREINLIMEDVCFEYYSSKEVESMRPQVEPVTYTPAESVAAFQDPGISAEVTAAGGMVIKVNQDTYFFTSEFSYAARPQMKFNTLTPESAEGEPGWKPSIKVFGKDQVLLEVASAAYQLKRSITYRNGKLCFTDTLTNRSQQDIGVKAVYSIVAEKLTPENYRLAGIPGTEKENGISENPTLFVQQDHSSVGVAVKDDAFRAHLELARNNNAVLYSEPNIGIPAGKSHSLEYEVFLSKETGYYHFLNCLRRDWDLNQTVLGPFCFNDWSKGMEVGIITVGPWYKYADGGGLTQEQYRDVVLKKISRIRQQMPHAKILAKIECNLIAIDKRTIPGGDKLPKSGKANGGQYGYLLNTEQSAIIARNTPYGDSLLRTEDGSIFVDTFYPAEPLLNLMVQVECGNARYKELMELIDYMTDELGLDGVYIDQFSAGCGGPLARKDRCSFDRWDGRTVALNEQGEIMRKYYDYAVTGISAREEIIRHVISKNKILVANTQPTSLKTGKGCMRFHEMENDNISSFILGEEKPPVLRHEAKSQLSPSPVILGLRPGFYSKNPQARAFILHRGVITALRHGLLYYYYTHGIVPGTGEYGILNYMYPMTPVELGEGFIIGKERILTAVSRSFSTCAKPVQVIVFDRNGRKKQEVTPVQEGDTWKTDIRLNDWTETAVIVLETEI